MKEASRVEWFDTVFREYFSSPAAALPQSTTYFIEVLDCCPDQPRAWTGLSRKDKFTAVNNRLVAWFMRGLIAKGETTINTQQRESCTWVRREVARKLVVER